MENQQKEALQAELETLLRKQTKVLESRCYGTATDSELLEYEIRQELLREIWEKLHRAEAA